jgi:GNAT superfamily N-acetyltransferase
MGIVLRAPQPADAAALGDACYRAFKQVAEAHNFPPDFPASQVAVGMMTNMVGLPHLFGVAAEADGRLVGSNFVDERNVIAGIGPVSVDPDDQNEGVGRALMDAALQRCRERGVPGVRLVQAGYHMRSLSLYLKLGFEAREHLSCLQGDPIGEAVAGSAVRAATPADLAACNRLCRATHGFERGAELADAVARGSARVVERAGRVTGYATVVAFFGHAVGESNDDLAALLASAEAFGGPGVLVPTRNGELMRWCLARGLRVTQTLTLMSLGLYNEPQGAWMPSVIY